MNVRTQASASLQYLDNDISALQAAEVEYQQNKSGPLTSPGGTTFGFQQLSVAELQDLGATELISNRANQSHIEYLFEPFFYPNMPTPEYAPLDNESYVSLTAAIIAPVSRGSVTLRSKNINDSPVINLNVSLSIFMSRLISEHLNPDLHRQVPERHDGPSVSHTSVQKPPDHSRQPVDPTVRHRSKSRRGLSRT